MIRALYPKLVVFAALAILAVLVLGAINWRAGKIAMLDPMPRPDAVASAALSPTPSSTPSSTPGGRHHGLLLFGDSRVAQWHPLPRREYKIFAAGFPGETAIRLSARLPAEISRTDPAVVMLQLGVNDGVAAAVVSRQRRQQALADSIAAFDQMAAVTAQSGAGLIILKVLPPIRPNLLRRLVYGSRLDTFVADLNAALPAIAARYGAALADPLALLIDANGEVPDRYRRDTLHLTPLAYEQLAHLFPLTLKAPG